MTASQQGYVIEPNSDPVTIEEVDPVSLESIRKSEIPDEYTAAQQQQQQQQQQQRMIPSTVVVKKSEIPEVVEPMVGKKGDIPAEYVPEEVEPAGVYSYYTYTYTYLFTSSWGHRPSNTYELLWWKLTEMKKSEVQKIPYKSLHQSSEEYYRNLVMTNVPISITFHHRNSYRLVVFHGRDLIMGWAATYGSQPSEEMVKLPTK